MKNVSHDSRIVRNGGGKCREGEKNVYNESPETAIFSTGAATACNEASFEGRRNTREPAPPPVEVWTAQSGGLDSSNP